MIGGRHPLCRSADHGTSIDLATNVTTIRQMTIGETLFPTTIAGSLPKPAWLAAPQKLWAPWRLEGEELTAGKDDATLLALKIQEDAGIDILTHREPSRQHLLHRFLEAVRRVAFRHRPEQC